MKIQLKNGASIEMEVIIRIEKDGYSVERYVSFDQLLYDMDGTMDRIVEEACNEIEQMNRGVS